MIAIASCNPGMVCMADGFLQFYMGLERVSMSFMQVGGISTQTSHKKRYVYVVWKYTTFHLCIYLKLVIDFVNWYFFVNISITKSTYLNK